MNKFIILLILVAFVIADDDCEKVVNGACGKAGATTCGNYKVGVAVTTKCVDCSKATNSVCGGDKDACSSFKLNDGSTTVCAMSTYAGILAFASIFLFALVL